MKCPRIKEITTLMSNRSSNRYKQWKKNHQEANYLTAKEISEKLKQDAYLFLQLLSNYKFHSMLYCDKI